MTACAAFGCGAVGTGVVCAASAAFFFFVGISAFRSLDAAALATAAGLGLGRGRAVTGLVAGRAAATARWADLTGIRVAAARAGFAGGRLLVPLVLWARLIGAPSFEALLTVAVPVALLLAAISTFLLTPLSRETSLPAALVAPLAATTLLPDSARRRAATDGMVLTGAVLTGAVLAGALLADAVLAGALLVADVDAARVATFVVLVLAAPPRTATSTVGVGEDFVSRFASLELRAPERDVELATFAEVPRGAMAALALYGMAKPLLGGEPAATGAADGRFGALA